EPAAARRGRLGDHVKAWWQNATRFDRRWVAWAAVIGLFSVFGTIIYTASSPQLLRYLTSIGFDGSNAAVLSGFSLREVWIYLGVLVLSVLVLVLVASGWLSGTRATAAFGILGAILVIDLVRANTPWVIHYDYQWRYQSNPVIDFLKEKPYEQR